MHLQHRDCREPCLLFVSIWSDHEKHAPVTALYTPRQDLELRRRDFKNRDYPFS